MVKGVRFELRDAGDPVERAQATPPGADELVVLDVSATAEARGGPGDRGRGARPSTAPTVGGGLRSVDAAARLLSAGADKVALNTAAFLQPDLIDQLADRFGRQCVVVAVDAARQDAGWARHPGRDERTGRDAVACAPKWQAGAGRAGG